MRFKSRRWQRAQSLVEFSLILPIIMTLTLSIAEFGMAYGTNMSMIEATREGARVGAVLGNGVNSYGLTGCTGATNVDPQIILAVQRVIYSPGSGITPGNIDWVRIFKSDANGNPVSYNQWTVGSYTSPTCGFTLNFSQGAIGWNASARTNVLPADSIGVSIQYRYRLFTPLSAITGLFGVNTITMVDQTVMDLEP
jgi:hypothetical protein